jgi:hypothetical protein
LRLADRNDNMMNFNVDLFVTLKTGNVKAYPWCNSEKEADSSLSSPSCSGTEWFEVQTPPDNRTKFPFALAKGRLVKRDTDGRTTRVATLGDGDFSEHQISPSGTWVSIQGNEVWGDYCHNDILLLNRADGQVWPVREGHVVPLTTKQLAGLAKRGVETLDVVGETSIHWIPGHDLLLIDGNLLVKPGEALIKLPGVAVF